jgi:hypothetical protein
MRCATPARQAWIDREEAAARSDEGHQTIKTLQRNLSATNNGFERPMQPLCLFTFAHGVVLAPQDAAARSGMAAVFLKGLPMVWRAMQEADLDAVSAISDAVHGDYTEPCSVYAERRDLFPQGCFVLDAGRGVKGYLIVHPWRHGGPPPLGEAMGALPDQPDSLYLHDLALVPDARGQEQAPAPRASRWRSPQRMGCATSTCSP